MRVKKRLFVHKLIPEREMRPVLKYVTPYIFGLIFSVEDRRQSAGS